MLCASLHAYNESQGIYMYKKIWIEVTSIDKVEDRKLYKITNLYLHFQGKFEIRTLKRK